MKYERQTQAALEKLDGALAQLRGLILKGQNKEAVAFMEQGPLKERFEELQSIIKISYTNTLGARGTQNVGTL